MARREVVQGLWTASTLCFHLLPKSIKVTHSSAEGQLQQATWYVAILTLSISCKIYDRLYVVFLVTEPIVLFLAIYISIVYGTLYSLFAGFPIVFENHRHFTTGQGGLAFLGIGLGIVLGVSSQSIQNRLYWKSMDTSETGRAPPEAYVHHSHFLDILLIL